MSNTEPENVFSRGVNHNSKGRGPVHEIRTKAKMTQVVFSQETGLSVATIRACETEGKWPASSRAKKDVLRFATDKGIEHPTSD